MSNRLYVIAGEHAGDRLMRAQALSSPTHLGGDAPPTPRQVAAVLHALADHTLLTRLLSDDVTELAADRQGPGQQPDGVGRYLQALADHVRGLPQDAPRPQPRTPAEGRWPLGAPA